MASIERRERNGQMRWYVRYRDPGGKQRVKVFTRKVDAQRYLTNTEAAKLGGTYVDPRRAAVTVGEWATDWLEAQAHLKPSTRDRYAGLLRRHVIPRWGSTPLAQVSHADIQQWVSGLALQQSPSTARKAHRVLSLALALAMRDGRLARNPATDIRLPRTVSAERRYLSHEQVAALASAAGRDKLSVLLLAYTGMRFGEMAALRACRIDPTQRKVEIAESVTSVNGALVWGTPKGHERRWVSLPGFLAELFAEHLDGKRPDELVFTSSQGKALRSSNYRRDVFTPAAGKAGLPGVVPHSLRHTAASLAIAAGADVKVVQQMLGHKSATMTLDLYGHLFENRLVEVADRLDAAARAAGVYPMCTKTADAALESGPTI